MVRLKKSSMIRVGFILIIAVLVLSSIFFYVRWQQEKFKTENPTLQAQNEIRAIIAKVSKFMDLPTGEEPTLANIVDPSKLSNQPFFVKAKAGDKVLIYTNAKLAILYDTKANRVLNVAPVNIGSASATPEVQNPAVSFV